MLEARILRLVEARGEDAGPGPGARGDSTARRQRRAFMAGWRSAEGAWTWIAPDSEEARSFLPGPFSLTLVLRDRTDGGSRA